MHLGPIFATALALWPSVAHFMELSNHSITRVAQTFGLRFGRIEPQDIAVAKATYAAVLVVFVGTSS